jgi:hypothetical protein
MEELQRPRHIRDIAHLYLSRTKSREIAPRRLILVTAASRNDFPGYHAANLALGFAQRGFAVNLFELSGLLPCSGYFLCLPPRVYLKHKSHSPQDPLSAVGGVTISFAPGENAVGTTGPAEIDDSSTRRLQTVELVHIPPLEYPERIEAVVSEVLRDGASGPRAVVFGATSAQAADVGKRAFRNGRAVDWFTVSLEGRDRLTANEKSAGQPTNLGYLPGWRRLLSDRVPCVLRDPASRVSRSYLSVCDALAMRFGASPRGPGPGGEWHHESGTFARTTGAGRSW